MKRHKKGRGKNHDHSEQNAILTFSGGIIFIDAIKDPVLKKGGHFMSVHLSSTRSPVSSGFRPETYTHNKT